MSNVKKYTFEVRQKIKDEHLSDLLQTVWENTPKKYKKNRKIRETFSTYLEDDVLNQKKKSSPIKNFSIENSIK